MQYIWRHAKQPRKAVCPPKNNTIQEEPHGY